MNEALVVFSRGIISFFTLLIFTRALGKQQLGEISYFDYILGITIGAFAAELTVDLGSTAWPHWVGLCTWTILGVLMQHISIASIKTAKYINDQPIIVIHNGRVLTKSLKEIKFTFGELLEQLRLKDIYNIKEVKFGIIEANGALSVLKEDDFQTILTANNILIDKNNVDNELIFSGILINDNMEKLNFDVKWIEEQLKQQNISDTTDVFYALLDSSNNLTINSYEDIMMGKKDILK